MFGLSSSLPLHVGGGGELVCETVDEADLQSDTLLIASSPGSELICSSFAICLRVLSSFAFKLSEVRPIRCLSVRGRFVLDN